MDKYAISWTGFFENTIEIRDVVEAAIIADLGYRHCAVNLFARRDSQSDVDDIIGNRFAGAQLEESAESSGCHAHQIRQLL